MPHLHDGEQDTLVVLMVVGVGAQDVHGVHPVMRKHVVEAGDEVLLAHALCDIVGREGRRGAGQGQGRRQRQRRGLSPGGERKSDKV